MKSNKKIPGAADARFHAGRVIRDEFLIKNVWELRAACRGEFAVSWKSYKLRSTNDHEGINYGYQDFIFLKFSLWTLNGRRRIQHHRSHISERVC